MDVGSFCKTVHSCLRSINLLLILDFRGKTLCSHIRMLSKVNLSAGADGLGLASSRDMKLAAITETTYGAVCCCSFSVSHSYSQ